MLIREFETALETEFLYRNREITWIYDAKKLDLSADGRTVNLVVQDVIQWPFIRNKFLFYSRQKMGDDYPLVSLPCTSCSDGPASFFIVHMPGPREKSLKYKKCWRIPDSCNCSSQIASNGLDLLIIVYCCCTHIVLMTLCVLHEKYP